ncbi:unnamed protein product [Peronospora effusa]|uniref:Agenet domain-containing protein n=1 Tax=Peronospora effusa TaxID=542832 RepID=A0A3M6VAA8_9STRA|nr:hypothetical protein DD238_007551 [Peronospora effusa]RQM09599.1 hypothetical protein DD237_007808 [Peronospora effusa]CAI5705688.1 unnamed protein product [Peronospora effusa]
MAELSFFARLVLTLLFSALSLFYYKWLQKPTTLALGPSTKRSKKRGKKKLAKKSAVSDSVSPRQELPQKSITPAALEIDPVAVDQADEIDDMSDSDSDDDRSAAEVLATRKFKPASLGGDRLARNIKASLPSKNVRFAVNQNVLARYQGRDRWFPATIMEQRKGNEYHLKYDDGEVEYRVPAEFIKLQPTKSKENVDNEENDALRAVKAEKVEEVAAVQGEASDSGSSASDDDGWQVVGTSKRQARRVQAASPAEPLVDGLTKRQRENRRKKERQREKKELLRQHAQKDDLDARARWRYVPS